MEPIPSHLNSAIITHVMTTLEGRGGEGREEKGKGPRRTCYWQCAYIYVHVSMSSFHPAGPRNLGGSSWTHTYSTTRIYLYLCT